MKRKNLCSLWFLEHKYKYNTRFFREVAAAAAVSSKVKSCLKWHQQRKKMNKNVLMLCNEGRRVVSNGVGEYLSSPYALSSQSSPSLSSIFILWTLWWNFFSLSRFVQKHHMAIMPEYLFYWNKEGFSWIPPHKMEKPKKWCNIFYSIINIKLMLFDCLLFPC